jgi:hypothetical protein
MSAYMILGVISSIGDGAKFSARWRVFAPSAAVVKQRAYGIVARRG